MKAESIGFRIAIRTGAAVMVLTAVAACTNKADLSSDKGKASYAIGMQIGKSLKSQNADVDIATLTAGMQDAVGGKEPKLKQEEMQAAMMKLQEATMKKSMEAATENDKKAEEYMKKNKEKAGMKSTDSGLQYEVTKEGTGASPKSGDSVKVHYTGTLITGEKFDSSRDHGSEPVTFPIDQVIPGWTEALKLMKIGGQYKLTIPPKLAYGPQGRPGIPPNSVLLFDVELIDVVAGTGAAPGPHGMPPGGPGGPGAPHMKDMKDMKAPKTPAKPEKK